MLRHQSMTPVLGGVGVVMRGIISTHTRRTHIGARRREVKTKFAAFIIETSSIDRDFVSCTQSRSTQTTTRNSTATVARG